jgi:imidazole glycerol-phosphate synthase subunit HisH
MKRVAVVNTRLTNLHSIARAVEECGLQPVVTDHPGDLESVANIILPGVGSFPRAMEHLRDTGLIDALSEQVIEKRIPFLGICLGMQLLATTGREGGDSSGLGWIDGEARLLQPDAGERVPHVGWNDIEFRNASPIFDGIATGQDFYFVHSYVLRPSDESSITATTSYAGGFAAAVQRDHIFGVQFHPEKSQKPGFAVLRNFLAV